MSAATNCHGSGGNGVMDKGVVVVDGVTAWHGTHSRITFSASMSILGNQTQERKYCLVFWIPMCPLCEILSASLIRLSGRTTRSPRKSMPCDIDNSDQIGLKELNSLSSCLLARPM